MAIPRFITAPLGYAASAVGRTYDYATPGSGTSTLTNAGRSIVDPNQVFNPGVAAQQGHSGSFYDVNPTAASYSNGKAPSTITGANDSYAQDGQTLGASDVTSYSTSPNYLQAQNLLQGQINRLPGQLDVAYGNIDRQYGVSNNELNSGFNQAQNTYGTQSTQNRQNLVTDRNNINDQASQGLRGLLRMLGAYGAGGSSDRLLAGDAVTNQANLQLSGAGQNYSGNQSALDTNWGNFQTQDQQERQKLDDWRNQQRQTAEQTSLSNRQSLLNQLASLQSSPTTAQTYLDQSNALNAPIDALSAFNPIYTGNTPVYSAPSLSSYNTGNTQIQAGGNAQSNTPFLSALLNSDDRRRRY